MANYISTTKTYVVEDHYDSDGNDRWQKATLKITVDANGNSSWKITMNNDSSENSYGTGRSVYLFVKVDGNELFLTSTGGHWVSHGQDFDAPGYKTYPCGNGTSDTGSFTVTSSNFSVEMKICCMQNPTGYPGRYGPDAQLSTTFTRDVWTAGSAAVTNITDKGNNTYTISGTYTPGTNNKLTGLTLYWTEDGSMPSTNSYGQYSTSVEGETTAKCILSVDTSKKTWSTVAYDVPNNRVSSTIKPLLVYQFNYNNGTFNTKTGTVKHYGNGGKPSTPTIKDNKNNTYTISGNVGTSGHNNTISTAKLNYTIAGVAQTAQTLTTTSGGTYTFTFNTPTNADSTTITAQVVRTMSWSGATVKNSSEGTATIPYYALIKTNPAVSITDNGNNTFTITGTNATGGNTNNTLTTAYAWGYSTSYDNSGTGTKTLTIATPANATRTVYAKATATLSVYGDPATVTASANIKQYVAPGNPGTPILSYSKSRLTIKEPWVFTWTAAASTNTSSPVAGYRLTLFKNGTERSNSIPIKDSSGTDISRYVDSVYIYDTTSLSFTVDPVQNGFVPGDTVVLAVRPYTKTPTGVCLYNANNTYSVAATVQNAGVVHVKQNGQWHEGQVWVKVAGTWKEAETVNVKVNGAWKESQ